ncbi:hypothetical protein BDY21DRAFT_334707 [Lineolata rhizophorae]|uniref:Uncharacterized protein n=1 Tax=Lineolata rhizophorae TaxID=578093 RepID=A0A6A6P877_9PEZI|nr:hypothetical protein BDY21DRAFT_334707 [Lineolata rhizophorae]
MATQSTSKLKADRERKLRSVITFASSLEQRIRVDPADAILLSDIQDHLKPLPLEPSAEIAPKRDQLERQGTTLWNLSTRLHRQASLDNGHSNSKLVCILRAFACMILESARPQRTTPALAGTIKLQKVALKAARSCIDQTQLELGIKVLERAAIHVEELEKLSQNEGFLDDDERVCIRLRVEYFMLRTLLHWKQQRLDLANHFFNQSGVAEYTLDGETAEMFADILLEIGQDQFRSKAFDAAVQWLERAHDLIDRQDRDDLSPDAADLHMCISSYFSMFRHFNTANNCFDNF